MSVVSTSSETFVVVTPEPDVLLQKWWGRSPQSFNEDRGMGGIRHFVGTNRPIRIWYDANSECGDVQSTFEIQKGTFYPSCSKPK
jgi:hypothetical protein